MPSSPEAIGEMIATTPTVPIARHLLRYVSSLVAATHPQGELAPPAIKRYVRWGASPRAGQSMVLAAKAAALLDGRPNVTADDIRWAAPAALRHRLVLGYEAAAESVKPDDLTALVIKAVEEPKPEIRGAP